MTDDDYLTPSPRIYEIADILKPNFGSGDRVPATPYAPVMVRSPEGNYVFSVDEGICLEDHISPDDSSYCPDGENVECCYKLPDDEENKLAKLLGQDQRYFWVSPSSCGISYAIIKEGYCKEGVEALMKDRGGCCSFLPEGVLTIRYYSYDTIVGMEAKLSTITMHTKEGEEFAFHLNSASDALDAFHIFGKLKGGFGSDDDYDDEAACKNYLYRCKDEWGKHNDT